MDIDLSYFLSFFLPLLRCVSVVEICTCGSVDGAVRQVSILPDCTLSLSLSLFILFLLHLFLSLSLVFCCSVIALSKSYLEGKELFGSPLMCRRRGGRSTLSNSLRAAGDGKGELDFFSFFFCVYHHHQHYYHPPTLEKDPFVYLLGSWRLSHLDRETERTPQQQQQLAAAARVFKCTVSLSILFNTFRVKDFFIFFPSTTRSFGFNNHHKDAFFLSRLFLFYSCLSLHGEVNGRGVVSPIFGAYAKLVGYTPPPLPVS